MYFVLCCVALTFVTTVFGIGPAVGLSLLHALPFAVAVRIRARLYASRMRDFVFLAIASVAALAASTLLVQSWYAAGMHRRHAEDVEYAAFSRRLRQDPRFDDVELFVSGKHVFWMRGTVAEEADLLRLRRLAAQYRIQWGDEVRVRDGQTGG